MKHKYVNHFEVEGANYLLVITIQIEILEV